MNLKGKKPHRILKVEEYTICLYKNYSKNKSPSAVSMYFTFLT